MTVQNVLEGLEPWAIVGTDARRGLAALPSNSIDCVVTSPPYWGLRSYKTALQPWEDGWEGELGSEDHPRAYIAHLLEVFRDVRRVLKPKGSLWLNIGDSYAGSGRGPTGHNGIGDQAKIQGFNAKGDPHGPRRNKTDAPEGMKSKDLCLIPEELSLALRDQGWWVRSRIAWCKTAHKPESVGDRPTTAWEHIYLLTKSRTYYYDQEAVRRETGGNLRNYWVLGPGAYKGAHYATFPPALVETCVKAGCPPQGLVLDPFVGSGTTVMVAQRLGRRALGFDLNPTYVDMARERVEKDPKKPLYDLVGLC